MQTRVTRDNKVPVEKSNLKIIIFVKKIDTGYWFPIDDSIEIEIQVKVRMLQTERTLCRYHFTYTLLQVNVC